VRIAVVTATQVASPWCEQALAVRRLAGALACSADVDVLLAGGVPIPGERDATVRVLRFATRGIPQQRRDAYLRAAFGLADFHQPALCACAEVLMRDLAAQVAPALQRRLADLACPDSPELRAHLRRESYDVLVVAGYAAAPMIEDSRCGRVVIAPLARNEPSLHLQVYDPLFERAASVVVFTDSEERLVRGRVGVDSASRVRNVGFVIHSNRAAVGATAPVASENPFILIARDWSEPFPTAWLARLAKGLNRRFPTLEICLAGPAVAHVGAAPGWKRRTVRAALDVEKWMGRALALFDPEPNRLLGREALVALLFGTPVIVPARGGATREHAEFGNGGLWYRSESEVGRCIELLGDPDLRSALGSQGRAYAVSRYGDAEAFTRRLGEAVCS
jgi:hypothetical protein